VLSFHFFSVLAASILWFFELLDVFEVNSFSFITVFYGSIQTCCTNMRADIVGASKRNPEPEEAKMQDMECFLSRG